MYNNFAEKRIVETFKTNIEKPDAAQFIVEKLQELFPGFRINFDLEDCDCILRIESLSSEINVRRIMRCVRKFNFEIEALI